MARTPVIQLKDVVKKFFLGNDELTILKGVNMEVFAGEYVILFGPSGSGKSTILNTIAGLEPTTSGDVIIRGENIAKFSGKELAKYRRSKIGIVFQQFNLIKSFKVWENIAFPLTNDRVPYNRRRDRANMLLGLFGLAKMGNRRPTELSGGQQQRVAMARALAANSWILIADEPTGNLDSRSASDVMMVFRLLNKKSHRTIIMVTHNPDYLKEADKVYYIKDGLIEKVQVNSHPPEYAKEAKEAGELADLKTFAFSDKDDESEIKRKKKEESPPAVSGPGAVDKTKG